MTDREKLIARLNASFEMQYSKRGLLTAQHTADDLISFGITFATENNVGCKWIPVSERLPEMDNIVLTWDGCDMGMHIWDNRNRKFVKVDVTGSTFLEVKFVTHWMPLPEPPKEEHNG